MKRVFNLLIILLLIFPIISATNIQVEKQSKDEVMIIDANIPAIFKLKVTNLGTEDNLLFYNFFGSESFPAETIQFNQKESKTIEVKIYPRQDIKYSGLVKFDMYIMGNNKESIEVPLTVKVIELKDAFEVGAEEFKPDSNKVSVYIKNKVNFDFENISIKLESPFFKFQEEIYLAPYQKKVFEVTLNKDDFRDLVAGYYTLNAEIHAEERKTKIEGVMRFSEKDIVVSSQNEYGIIINTKTITKMNEGNVVSPSSTIVKKNIISRLFTTFSPEPDIVERSGTKVYYTWEKELRPGEELKIVIKTNWLLPLLAILLIVAIILLTKQFSKTDLILKKRVNFVKAKGGEFALKVSLIVTARNFIERVNVIDRLPFVAKLHERFGGEIPNKVDEKNRKLEWYFDKLEAGESRVISYIIYSKVGVLGKFVLPTTTAIYEKEGKVREAESNQAFFIAEQAKKQIED